MDYNFTINNKEDFDKAQSQLIGDFISQITNAEVTADWRTPHTGRIVSCLNPCNSFESVIASVYFGDTDETKSYGIVAAINCCGLLFVDESVKALYDEFAEVNENIKHQLFVATQEARRREKEAEKKAKQKEAQEKKKAEAEAKKKKETEEADQ